MNYRVLGPIEVDAGAGPLPLAGKPQALMALLLLHANETLSGDRIAEELGCDAVDDVGLVPPRQILPEDVLEQHWGGYRLRVPDGELDLQRFEALAREAGDAEPTQAARLLREALALWRGPPLAGLREPFVRGEAARLEGLRISAHDAQLEAERASSHHVDLEALIQQQPQRERFMLSVYPETRSAARGALPRPACSRSPVRAASGRPGSRASWPARSAPEYPGGVHFVSLEAVADPDLVTTTILLALGLRQERHRLDVLVAELRDTRTLLVLDHFDHVRDAAMDMAVLLRRTRGPTLLLTSRKGAGR